MLIDIINKGSILVKQLILWGLLYLTSCFHLFWKNILSAMHVDWVPPHLSLVVCYIFHLLLHLPCNTWFYKDCNKNGTNLVLDVIITLDTSNQAIYCNLKNICFSSLIDLDTLTIMSPKIDAPYLWIRPLCFVPPKFSLRATIDHHGPSILSGHYTASINCCKNIILRP